MKSFEVKVYTIGHTYVFYGDDVRRDTTDGSGTPILYAPCMEIDEAHKLVLNRGVINLNPDWTVKSIVMR